MHMSDFAKKQLEAIHAKQQKTENLTAQVVKALQVFVVPVPAHLRTQWGTELLKQFLREKDNRVRVATTAWMVRDIIDAIIAVENRYHWLLDQGLIEVKTEEDKAQDKTEKVKFTPWAERKVHDGEVNWSKQATLQYERANPMAALMGVGAPERGRTLAASPKAKQNKRKRK